MKCVMISIQPRWVEKILSEEKTIEVRKTRPNLETPFKCYIYQTKGEKINDGWDCAIVTKNNDMYYGGQKVIGEFICDKIYDITPHNDGYSTNQYICGWKYGKDNSCLDFEQLNNYLKGEDGYGWHISELKIYDKPKELYEFKKGCKERFSCLDCKKNIYFGGNCEGVVERPFQSWGYIQGE